MLYFLDTDPQRAVRLLADVDVRCAEAVFALAGVAHEMRVRVEGPFACCAVTPWMTRCASNWSWAVAYGQEMMNEHLYRFGRLHPGMNGFSSVLEVDAFVKKRLPRAGITLPPLLRVDHGRVFVEQVPMDHLSLLAVSHVTRWRWAYGSLRRGEVWTKRSVPEFIEEIRRVRERREARISRQQRTQESKARESGTQETRIRRVRLVIERPRQD